MSYKTTKTDFEYFKKQCKYWIDFFGVKDWEIDFTHGENDEDRAGVRCQPNNRYAEILFGNEWTEKPNKKEIDFCAFHEVLEIIFTDIRGLFSKNVTENEADKEVHRIIRMLENTLWEGR